MNKICKTCHKEKDISEFGIHSSGKNTNFKSRGKIEHKKHCKPCTALKAKEWRAKNPDYHKRQRKISKYSKEEKYIISSIRTKVSEAKQNNKRTTREFTIDSDYMFDLFMSQEGICYLTGFKLQIDHHNPYALSIDKIIPTKGYVKGNVKWCCWMANRAKGDLDMNTLLNLCKAIQEKCRDYPAMEYTPSGVEAVNSSKEDDDIVRTI